MFEIVVFVVSEVKEELGPVFAHMVAVGALKGLKGNVSVDDLVQLTWYE